MASTPPRSIRLTFVLLLCSLSGLACSGGGSSATDVLGQELSAQFSASSTNAAPELVHLASQTSQGDTVVLDIVIEGPTTSTDLYSFAFDIVVGDPAVASYVPGSVTLGDALTLSAPQGVDVLASQNGNRIVVGVSKTNGGSGNGITRSQNTVVSLALRVLRPGSTSLSLDGPPSGGPPVALDSAGVVVPDLSFDGGPASITAL